MHLKSPKEAIILSLNYTTDSQEEDLPAGTPTGSNDDASSQAFLAKKISASG
jgi:hypothetical protein